MSEEKTLLVIGAGASVDFSHNNGVNLKEPFAFPSGEELLEKLKNRVIGGFTTTEEFAEAYKGVKDGDSYVYSYPDEYEDELPKSLLNGALGDKPFYFAIKSPERTIQWIKIKTKDTTLKNKRYKTGRLHAPITPRALLADMMEQCGSLREEFIFEFGKQGELGRRGVSMLQATRHHLESNFYKSTFYLNELLIHLLNLHKPLSIDYYISNNLKSHITEEHLKNAKRLELTLDNKPIETKEDLEKAVEKHAIKKITHILSNCKVENLQNGYFANILCNYITLDKIQNLEIITFNYDLILEQTIDYLIENNIDDKRKKKLEKLKNRIKHVYGDVNKGITFIRKVNTKGYQTLLNKAKSIYFLGFGFDETNLKNLGIDKGFAEQKERLVFITNFSKLSKLEYAVERAFKCKFEFVREGSRKCYKGEEYFIIAEKSITESLKGDFFFI